MDALMAALVAALLIHTTDRTPWLIAEMGARYRQHALVLVGAAAALAMVNGLAASGGALIAARLTPNARALFLAAALGMAGLGCLVRPKPPDVLPGWRTGPLLTPLVGTLTLGFGSAQFLAMAIALRSGTAVFAAIGATIGATIGGGVVAAAALGLGPRGVVRLRAAAIRIPIGAVMMVAAAIAALSALRLI